MILWCTCRTSCRYLRISKRSSLVRSSSWPQLHARADRLSRWTPSRQPGSVKIKETIEIMNWTNEIWHQFRNFSAFFRIFRALLMRISWHFIIFWEYPWNSDKIPSKFRREMTKFIDQSRNEISFHFISFHSGQKVWLFFWNFEVLAVWRQRNLAELEKR